MRSDAGNRKKIRAVNRSNRKTHSRPSGPNFAASSPIQPSIEYLCRKPYSTKHEFRSRNQKPSFRLESDSRPADADSGRHGGRHADRGPDQSDGGTGCRLPFVVVRPAVVAARGQFHADGPQNATGTPPPMGRPAAALRTRRDAGGSIRHACVGIRRLHAHPRGRDLEPDDDDRPQRARSTFRNHAEPIHVEPLPRIAESPRRTKAISPFVTRERSATGKST